MKTLKSKKSTISEKSEIVFLKYKPIDSYFKFAILAYRLQQCIHALNEYSNIPTQNDASTFVIKELSESEAEKNLKALLSGKTLPQSKREDDNIKELIRDCTNALYSLEEILKSMDKSERNHVNSIHRYVFNNIIQKSDISDEQSLQSLCDACCLFSLPQHNPGKKISDNDIKEVMNIEQLLITKVGEALGYWTVKLAAKKRGKNSVKKRTDIKEEYKSKLKEMMKTMKPQEYRLKAQQVFGVTDRTVLNWHKEIKEEKTAILRKNTDTA